MELPGVDEVEEEPGHPDAEAVYRWTVRTLYLVAIALNVWVLWDSVKDRPEVELRRREWTARLARITAPLRARRVWHVSRDRMHRQAQWALVEGEEADGDGNR